MTGLVRTDQPAFDHPWRDGNRDSYPPGFRQRSLRGSSVDLFANQSAPPSEGSVARRETTYQDRDSHPSTGEGNQAPRRHRLRSPVPPSPNLGETLQEPCRERST